MLMITTELVMVFCCVRWYCFICGVLILSIKMFVVAMSLWRIVAFKLNFEIEPSSYLVLRAAPIKVNIDFVIKHPAFRDDAPVLCSSNFELIAIFIQ